jgi:hypothetical protein
MPKFGLHIEYTVRTLEEVFKNLKRTLQKPYKSFTRTLQELFKNIGMPKFDLHIEYVGFNSWLFKQKLVIQFF